VNKDGEFAYQELYEIECVPMNGSMARETLLTGMYWWFPVWSPDGSVFTASLWDSVEDRFGRIAIVDPKTKEYEYITPREWDSWWQAISPDNAKVVFGASEDPFNGFKRLYIMNLDRSELRLLVP
jgi:Tol biopolymer transport system component